MKTKQKLSFFSLLFAIFFSAQWLLAAKMAKFQVLPFELINGVSLKSESLASFGRDIQPGTILVIGEQHGELAISENQRLILEFLRSRGLIVSVGMEFFNFTDQFAIDDFRSGVLTEEAFKSIVKWSGFDFSLYSHQLLFPNLNEGAYGLGINVPRTITQAISKGGYNSLTPEQKLLLPSDFSLGNSEYRERFYNLMGDDHIPADKLALYFEAQSAWDEAMSYQTLEFMKNHLDQVFVIVVGEFHVQYGGGLPARLKDRIDQLGLFQQLQVKTLSQILTQDLTEDEVQTQISVHEKYGPRADWIMLVK